MMTLKEIREKLKDRKMTVVSSETGIHVNAIYRFMNDQTKPKYDTVKKLIDYLEGTESDG